jgi:hypothetical protein
MPAVLRKPNYQLSSIPKSPQVANRKCPIVCFGYNYTAKEGDWIRMPCGGSLLCLNTFCEHKRPTKHNLPRDSYHPLQSYIELLAIRIFKLNMHFALAIHHFDQTDGAAVSIGAELLQLTEYL